MTAKRMRHDVYVCTLYNVHSVYSSYRHTALCESNACVQLQCKEKKATNKLWGKLIQATLIRFALFYIWFVLFCTVDCPYTQRQIDIMIISSTSAFTFSRHICNTHTHIVLKINQSEWTFTRAILSHLPRLRWLWETESFGHACTWRTEISQWSAHYYYCYLCLMFVIFLYAFAQLQYVYFRGISKTRQFINIIHLGKPHHLVIHWRKVVEINANGISVLAFSR